MTGLHEARERLWIPVAAPVIWAVHFTLSYVTAAIWCGRFGGASASLGSVRIAIAAYTVVAAVLMCALFRHGLQRHRFGDGTVPHDAATPEDRHRFLGFTTMLLAGLSLVATIFVALAAIFIETCR